MATLQELRKEKGLTQEQVGNAIGKPKTYICDLEKGKRSIKSITTETALKLAELLGTTVENLADPSERLDDKNFEWEKIYDNGDDKDYFLVVDFITYNAQANQMIFLIDGLWYYQPHSLIFNKSIPIDRQLSLIIKDFDYLIERKQRGEHIFEGADYDYLRYHCVPRCGFNVELGRAITQKEMDKIIEKYNLTSDDMSSKFIYTKGAIYGEKYSKSYTAVQIRIDGNGITLEHYLRDLGIEASSGYPGRVNIRIE